MMKSTSAYAPAWLSHVLNGDHAEGLEVQTRFRFAVLHALGAWAFVPHTWPYRPCLMEVDAVFSKTKIPEHNVSTICCSKGAAISRADFPTGL